MKSMRLLHDLHERKNVSRILMDMARRIRDLNQQGKRIRLTAIPVPLRATNAARNPTRFEIDEFELATLREAAQTLLALPYPQALDTFLFKYRLDAGLSEAERTLPREMFPDLVRFSQSTLGAALSDLTHTDHD